MSSKRKSGKNYKSESSSNESDQGHLPKLDTSSSFPQRNRKEIADILMGYRPQSTFDQKLFKGVFTKALQENERK